MGMKIEENQIDEPNKMISDEVREKLVRLIYEKRELAETYDDCTEDEFIARVFKGWVIDMGFDKDEFIYKVFGVDWKALKPLCDFCEQNGLEMDIEGCKSCEMFLIEIRLKRETES